MFDSASIGFGEVYAVKCNVFNRFHNESFYKMRSHHIGYALLFQKKLENKKSPHQMMRGHIEALAYKPSVETIASNTT